MGYKDATARALAPMAPLLERGSDELFIVNNWLSARGLVSLASSGVHTDGWRILAKEPTSHDGAYYSVVELHVRDAEGVEAVRPMRFMRNRANGGRGCILVVMVNDHIATVR